MNVYLIMRKVLPIPNANDFQFLPKDFQFRENQLQVIQKAIIAWNSQKSEVILDAPTGSGKSIIALCISYWMNKHLLEGYILASDLSLQSQYENDILNFNLDIPSVKGIDNYLCTRTNTTISTGYCNSRCILGKYRVELTCYNTCPYFSVRDLAIQADTCLLNYSYWFIVRNNPMPEEFRQFKKRDFVIFDEAHKLDLLVFEHFAPKLDKNFFEKFQPVVSYLNTLVGTELYEAYTQIEFFDWKIYYNQMYLENNREILFDMLSSLKIFLSKIIALGNTFKQNLNAEYTETLPASINDIIKKLDFIKDVSCKVTDFLTLCIEGGKSAIIKTLSKEQICFYHNNSWLYFKNFIRNQSKFRIYMSATFGNIDLIKKNYYLRESDTEYINMPSIFNYDKSPIILVNNAKKLTWENKKDNLSHNLNILQMILKNHPNDKGIIHTHSYDVSQAIVDSNISDRFISYTNKDKISKINEFVESSNKILIGPSHIEGLNFNDDKSRFQIFMKAPYLNLSNFFIKIKSIKSKDWYNWKMSLNLLQGSGRSIRHENDWAVTYLIDASFISFILRHTKFFSIEFLKRIIIKNIK